MNNQGQIIAISSGKGGVGKSHLCANLGLALAQSRLSVCLHDADHGLANLSLLLGQNSGCSQRAAGDDAAVTVEQTVTKLSKLHHPIHKTRWPLDIQPSTTGHEVTSGGAQVDFNQIQDDLTALRQVYDVVLLDTPAGIEHNVQNYLALADKIVLVITPEPTSLTDSFGLIRVLKQSHTEYLVIANQVNDVSQANEVYRRFSRAVKKYIGNKTRLLGYINHDSTVTQAVMKQTPLLYLAEDSPAARSIKRTSQTLLQLLQQQNREQQSSSRAQSQRPNVLPLPLQQPTPFMRWANQLDEFVLSDKLSPEVQQERLKYLQQRLSEAARSLSLSLTEEQRAIRSQPSDNLPIKNQAEAQSENSSNSGFKPEDKTHQVVQYPESEHLNTQQQMRSNARQTLNIIQQMLKNTVN